MEKKKKRKWEIHKIKNQIKQFYFYFVRYVGVKRYVLVNKGSVYEHKTRAEY